MTEKQITKRMSEAYEYLCGDDALDEWYGTDEPTIWKFYRPREKTTYLLEMDEMNKRVTCKHHNDAELTDDGDWLWHSDGIYSWR